MTTLLDPLFRNIIPIVLENIKRTTEWKNMMLSSKVFNEAGKKLAIEKRNFSHPCICDVLKVYNQLFDGRFFWGDGITFCTSAFNKFCKERNICKYHREFIQKIYTDHPKEMKGDFPHFHERIRTLSLYVVKYEEGYSPIDNVFLHIIISKFAKNFITEEYNKLKLSINKNLKIMDDMNYFTKLGLNVNDYILAL